MLRIVVYLNELFFNEFYSFRSKFTLESIEKLIDIGTKIIICSGFLDYGDDSLTNGFWRGTSK